MTYVRLESITRIGGPWYTGVCEREREREKEREKEEEGMRRREKKRDKE